MKKFLFGLLFCCASICMLEAQSSTASQGTTTAGPISGGAVSSAALDTLFGTTQGAVIYRNATAWVALAPGTSGNFLKTQGAAANPVWAAAGGTVTTSGSPANTQVSYFTSATAISSNSGFTSDTSGNVMVRSLGVAVAASGTSGRINFAGGSTITDDSTGNLAIVPGGSSKTLTLGNSSTNTISIVVGTSTLQVAANQFTPTDNAMFLGVGTNRWNYLHMASASASAGMGAGNGIAFSTAAKGTGAVINASGASGSEVFTFTNAGTGPSTFNTGIKTGAPASGTAGYMKWGVVVTGLTLTPLTTSAIQIEGSDGGTYYMILATR